MCLIMICETARPSNAILKKAFTTNNDGIGIAWIKDKKIHYRKGIKLKKLRELVKILPMPFVIHFRIATIGGIKKELCHPFNLEYLSPTKLEGKTDSVLFHNGHWFDYDNELSTLELNKELLETELDAFESEPVSDSRVMALLANVRGIDYLKQIVNQKICVLTPDKVYTFGTFHEKQGISYSNTSLWYTPVYTYENYQYLDKYKNEVWDNDKSMTSRYEDYEEAYNTDYDFFNKHDDIMYHKAIKDWSGVLKRQLSKHEKDDVWVYGYPLGVKGSERYTF